MMMIMMPLTLRRTATLTRARLGRQGCRRGGFEYSGGMILDYKSVRKQSHTLLSVSIPR